MSSSTSSRSTSSAATPTRSAPTLPDSADDEARRSELKHHKARATGLLVLATLAFLALVIWTDGQGWSGYAEAAAEAAMVGGVADWFAVTALFRHPLRLPIPHTAIIPKRKDQIGESLGEFVQENFLKPEVLQSRLSEADLASRIGNWLEVPGNARKVGDQLSTVLGSAIEVMRDDELQASVEGYIARRVDTFEPTPLAARAIEFAIEGGHHHAIFDAGLDGMRNILHDNKAMLRGRLSNESPWWVPEPIDDRIFDKIYAAINTFIDEVTADPDHEFRRNLDTRIEGLAVRLRESPELRQRAHELKAELLAHPATREWTSGLWDNMKQSLLLAADDPTSELRLRIHQTALNTGESLRNDPALRTKVNNWLVNAVAHLAGESRTEIADLISTTVAGWDAEETSERIELQVGRDLQYIRINGTVVGGLVGVLIHAVAHLLG